MIDLQPSRRFRFGAFEADLATGELRRKGLRIKLNAQPFEVLIMLLDRAGETVSREDISRTLWPDGTFVDYEHGVNSAVNRIREALGDVAANPRFVETLARRGYRFIAPVEVFDPADELRGVAASPGGSVVAGPIASSLAPAVAELPRETDPAVPGWFAGKILASADELPQASHAVVQCLFLLLQAMYLAFYVGALANLAEIEELFAPLPRPTLALNFLIVIAAILIPVRAFVVCAVLFRAPGVRDKFLKIWPLLLIADELWSLAPFLLLHHINFGMALACTTLLVYSPFAQRSLVLMGAGTRSAKTSTPLP